MIRFTAIAPFGAWEAAVRLVTRAGFSVGSTCVNCPVGIMHGDWLVAKWRNLSKAEREACHGTISGDRRTGPIMVTLSDACPPAAREAFIAEASELEGLC